jgi:hypothetical protein
MNVDQNLWLFNKINNFNTNRNITLYDRLTDEQVYTRSISPVLYNFLPQYGNITPFGAATPNRTGITAGLGTDTSAKIINAEASVDLYNELIGEGVADKRSFTGIKGGLKFNFGDLLKLNRKMSVNVGMRQEITKRTGAAPIDFKSMLVDLGATIETFKKLDLMIGLKLLNASGNEYLSTRDQFNLLNSFTEYNVNLTEGITSFGLRVRFSDRSYLSGTYNTSVYKETTFYNYNYNLNQAFFNYTLIF